MINKSSNYTIINDNKSEISTSDKDSFFSFKTLKDKTVFNVIKEMDVYNMERCVRSCITEAFEKNKGLFKRSKLYYYKLKSYLTIIN